MFFRCPQDVAWIEQDPRFSRKARRVADGKSSAGSGSAGSWCPSLADHLRAGRPVKELKELCRSLGFKVSGTGEVLVARLVEGAPDRISELVAGKTVLRCSPRGAETGDG